MVIATDVLLAAGSGALALLALSEKPPVWAVYVIAGCMSGVNGLQRPSLDALTPRLVDKAELPAAAALSGFRGSLGMIVGPAGGPGQVDVPLRIAVVEETPTGTKAIVTKLIRIPVTIGNNDQNALFTHIEDGLSFPMPPSADLDNYTVYIGFDPQAAEAQDKHNEKPRPRKLKPKSE